MKITFATQISQRMQTMNGQSEKEKNSQSDDMIELHTQCARLLLRMPLIRILLVKLTAIKRKYCHPFCQSQTIFALGNSLAFHGCCLIARHSMHWVLISMFVHHFNKPPAKPFRTQSKILASLSLISSTRFNRIQNAVGHFFFSLH